MFANSTFAQIEFIPNSSVPVSVPVVAIDTHDYIPDFWFKLWEKKSKKKPDVDDVIALVAKAIDKPTKEVKQALAQYDNVDIDLTNINEQIRIYQRIIAIYDEIEEEELLMLLH